jgi:MarR family transcriptional regulator, lower aerobic nicotinate degradation pathway regulator
VQSIKKEKMSKKIVELVNLWAAYEQDEPELSIQDFCIRYLSEQTSAPIKDICDEPINIPINNWLGALSGRISRYALMYTKKALAPLNLSSIDDMVYLIIVQEHGNPRKSEVIHQALSEFPSGIDVIKRLVKMELLEELHDETDRRSKRLRITNKGQEMLWQSMELVSKASDAAFSTLTPAEKMMLSGLLDRLDKFHWNHYKETRSAEGIDEIMNILTVK